MWNVDKFISALTILLDDEQDFLAKEYVILGDFNINYSSKKMPETRKLITWQNKYGLSQLIKGNTRSAKTSRSLIDLIFTNMDHCHETGVIELHLSDHQPVYVVKKKPRDNRAKTCFSGRTYMMYNKDLLSDSLTNNVKNSFLQCEDPNQCWEQMENFLRTFLDVHCPIKTFRTRENTPAWVTREIIVMAKDRDRAWKQAKTTNSDEDWARARRFRNWTNNATKLAKANYVQNELNNNAKNPKKFWRNIKDVLPDQSKGSINILNPLTKEILPKHLQAQEINSFFANIGENLARNFKGKPLTLGPPAPDTELLNIREITQMEVIKLIDTISVSKSSGLDNVSSRVIKDFLSLASKEVTALYNRILRSGIFPDKWKIATVTPIPKVSNATNRMNLDLFLSSPYQENFLKST